MLDVLESDIGQGTLGGVDPDTLDLRRSNQWYRFADFFFPPSTTYSQPLSSWSGRNPRDKPRSAFNPSSEHP